MRFTKRMCIIPTLVGAFFMIIAGYAAATVSPTQVAKMVVQTITGTQVRTPQSAQTRFFGACGGGTTFDDAVAGWRNHSVLDDVERAAGISPNGLDGPPLRLLRKALVRVQVVSGAMAGNSTCKSGTFVGLTTLANQPTGSFVWTVRSWIGKDGQLTRWWPDNCGNFRHGLIAVAVPQKSVPPLFGTVTVEKLGPAGSKVSFRFQAFDGWTGKISFFRLSIGQSRVLRFLKGHAVTFKENGAKGWQRMPSQTRVIGGNTQPVIFVNQKVTTPAPAPTFTTTTTTPAPTTTVVQVACSSGQVVVYNSAGVAIACQTQTQTQSQTVIVSLPATTTTVVTSTTPTTTTVPTTTTTTPTTTVVTTTAPPANRPPLVQILNAPAHVFVSGQVQICAQISDPDGDAVIVTIKPDPGWTRGTTSAPSLLDSQKWCTTYTAPATTGDDIVTFRVSDGVNPVVEVSTPRFPIVAGSGSNF